MIINTNVTALNTYSALSNANSALSKSTAKLSSGFRINSAADDAAGLAISEKMRSQINGLDQAERNAQDGISMIQTAEGALSETESILQRTRELAVQAANDTNTSSDREQIQQELDQLISELDRIADTTEFNTKKLLNGGAGLGVTTNAETVAGVSTNWIEIVGGTADTQISSLAGADIDITAATAATGATTTITMVDGSTGTFDLNGVSMSFSDAGLAADNATAFAALINNNSDTFGATATVSGADVTITNSNVGSASNLVLNGATLEAAATADDTFGSDATITDATIGANYVASGNKISVISGVYEGLELQLTGSAMSTTAADNDANLTINSNGVVNMQIGANEGQNMNISISDMRASALGVSAIDVASAASAQAAITTLDTAISSVSTERAKLGSYQNRLEHTINNLSTSSYNLTAAESRIRDVDMAKEMMTYTTQSILVQSSTAMLAQANQQPQSVLQLLG